MTADPGPFSGVAPYYSRFRPGYPPEVFDYLSDQAELSLKSSVLDLGCGTGQMALALASRVGSVTAVDVDSGMLDEARRLARERGCQNIRFVQSAAEDFEDERTDHRLVVVASAFHWMDRERVSAKAHGWLEPSGVFAAIGNPTPLAQIRVREGMGEVIADVQDRWLDSADAMDDLSRPEVVIRESPFGDATITYIPTEQHWDIYRFVGFLCSTSWRPDRVLGKRFPDFVNDLTAAIRAKEPSGEWIYRSAVEVILARRQ